MAPPKYAAHSSCDARVVPAAAPGTVLPSSKRDRCCRCTRSRRCGGRARRRGSSRQQVVVARTLAADPTAKRRSRSGTSPTSSRYPAGTVIRSLVAQPEVVLGQPEHVEVVAGTRTTECNRRRVAATRHGIPAPSSAAFDIVRPGSHSRTRRQGQGPGGARPARAPRRRGPSVLNRPRSRGRWQGARSTRRGSARRPGCRRRARGSCGWSGHPTGG